MGYARKDVEKTKKLAKKFVRYGKSISLGKAIREQRQCSSLNI